LGRLRVNARFKPLSVPQIPIGTMGTSAKAARYAIPVLAGISAPVVLRVPSGAIPKTPVQPNPAHGVDQEAEKRILLVLLGHQGSRIFAFKQHENQGCVYQVQMIRSQDVTTLAGKIMPVLNLQPGEHTKKKPKNRADCQADEFVGHGYAPLQFYLQFCALDNYVDMRL
jgi:hypothetical protein